MTAELRRRDTCIDLVKAIAVLSVLIIHTCSAGYAQPVSSFGFLSSVFWGSAARPAVPLFFLCSGALLLAPERELPLRRLLTHNVLRILIALFLWAAAYKCYHLLTENVLNLPALWQALKELLTFQHEFHFYYLHILLIVYLFLPVTRVWVKHASPQELRYGLLLWFLLGILYPTVKQWWPFTLLRGIPSQWLINQTYAAIGYGVLGHYLTRCPLSRRAGLLLTAGGFALVFGGTVIGSLRLGALYEAFLEGMTVGVMLMAAGVFTLCRGVSLSPEGLIGRGTVLLSRASFCIYLCHVFWLYLLRALGLTAAAFAPVLSIPLFALLNLALSLATWAFLRRIPLVNRWCI